MPRDPALVLYLEREIDAIESLTVRSKSDENRWTGMVLMLAYQDQQSAIDQGTFGNEDMSDFPEMPEILKRKPKET